MSTEIKHKRPKYTLDFKKDAAKLVIEKGYTHEQAATNLGISKSAIGRWVRAEEGTSKKTNGNPPKPNLDQHAEILRLRKENEQLRMEREILKNRSPGNPAPYEKKQFAHTLAWRTDTGRLLFGG
jgi:transposase